MKRHLEDPDANCPTSKKRKISAPLSEESSHSKIKQQNNKNNHSKKKRPKRKKRNRPYNEQLRRKNENELIERIIQEIDELLPQAKHWLDLDQETRKSFYFRPTDRKIAKLQQNHTGCELATAKMEEALSQYCQSSEYLSGPHKRKNSHFERARSALDKIRALYIPPQFIKEEEHKALLSSIAVPTFATEPPSLPQSIVSSSIAVPTFSTETPSLPQSIALSSIAEPTFTAEPPIQHRDNDNGIHLGQRFSYWDTFKDYEFIKPKYNNFQQELLQNNIQAIEIHLYLDLQSKVCQLMKDIHGMLNGTNHEITCYAHDRPPWNMHTKIEPLGFIQPCHILAILLLLHQDLRNIELPQALQRVCLRDTGVGQSVQQRHSEYAHWLKSLFESIVLYGKEVSETAYFGFYDNGYNFSTKSSIQIELGMPLRGYRMNGEQAIQFASNDNGFVLQYNQPQSHRATYFDASLLSKDSQQPQLIFFHASLQILNVNSIQPIPATIRLPLNPQPSQSTAEPPKLDTELPTTTLDNVFCPTCNTKMSPILVHRAYSCRFNPIQTILCDGDGCDIEKKPNEYVYHCPRGYQSARYGQASHERGFDLCLSCAKLEKYHSQNLIDIEDTEDMIKNCLDQDYECDEEEESETDYEEASVSSETSIPLYEMDEDNLENKTNEYIENEYDQSDSMEDEEVTKEERNQFDQVYGSIKSSLRWQCSTVDFRKGFKGCWKSKINELRRSPSSAKLKQDYPLCGTCSFSFGSNVSSPLQCTYGKVPRCNESNGYHHFGSFMPNRSIAKQICFWCDSWYYFKKKYHLSFKDALQYKNIFDYIIDYQQSQAVPSTDQTPENYDHKDVEIARLKQQLAIQQRKIQQLQQNTQQMLGFYDKLLANVLKSYQDNKFIHVPRTTVGVPFFPTKMTFTLPKAAPTTPAAPSKAEPTLSTTAAPSKAVPTTNKDNGRVYFIRCDIFKKSIFAFIHYEFERKWECKEWTDIHNREHLEELSRHFKGIPRCQQPGYSTVNSTVLSKQYGSNGSTTASVVRVGNINSGAYLIDNYFTEEEENAIVVGHRLIMDKYKDKINAAFKVFIDGDVISQDIVTADQLKNKSTIWLQIIIRYHAVASPQLHLTDFGRSKYEDKLKEIIDNEQDLNAIIKYVEVILNSYGTKFEQLCSELDIEYSGFAAYQSQLYQVNKTDLSERLKGHRDTWKLGDRGFAAGTFINSSTIVFCDRFGQRIIYKLHKPVRSLLIVQPQSFMATKAKHKLIGNMETESLSTLARMESTDYNLKIDTQRRINRSNSKHKSSAEPSTKRVKRRKNTH